MSAQSDEALSLLPLDEANPTPLYLQLQQSIEEAVRKGALKADAALPGERDLARQLGISRVTVRKAITGLVQKGVLVQRWGSGTFISPQMRLEQPLSRLSSFTDDMSARGLKSSAVMLSQSTGPASTDELMALGLSPGDLVSRVNRLRLRTAFPWRSRTPSSRRAFCRILPWCSNPFMPCCTRRASCRPVPCSGSMPFS